MEEGQVVLASLLTTGGMAVFDRHPELLEIWPEAATENMLAATRRWTEDPTDGEIFLIFVNREVAGLTGWYEIDDGLPTRAEIGLRWHGLVPRFRKRGMSRAALGMLARRLPKQALFLYDLATREDVIAYFAALWFTVCDKPCLLGQLPYGKETVLRGSVPFLRTL